MAKKTAVTAKPPLAGADRVHVSEVDPIRAKVVACIVATFAGVTAESLGVIPEHDLRQGGSNRDLEIFNLMAALEDGFGLVNQLGAVYNTRPLFLSNIIAMIKDKLPK